METSFCWYLFYKAMSFIILVNLFKSFTKLISTSKWKARAISSSYFSENTMKLKGTRRMTEQYIEFKCLGSLCIPTKLIGIQNTGHKTVFILINC